jgi:hypothetical protein
VTSHFFILEQISDASLQGIDHPSEEWRKPLCDVMDNMLKIIGAIASAIVSYKSGRGLLVSCVSLFAHSRGSAGLRSS